MAECQVATCEEQAVAYLLTQNKYARHAEPRDTLCRTHYVEDRRAEGRIVACEALKNTVVLRDVSGHDVGRRGERVEFDEDETNVGVLVRCGFVKRLDGPSLAESLAAEEEVLAARLAATKARRIEADKQAKAEAKEASKGKAGKADANDANAAEAVAVDDKG